MANAADNFNRANGALGGSTCSDGIHTWDTATGWGIVSNQADPDATGNRLARIDPGCADCDVGVTLAVMQGSNLFGLIGRNQSFNEQIRLLANTTSIRLYRVVGGTATEVGTAFLTVGDGDAIRLHMVGDQVSAYHTPSGGSESLVISPVTITQHVSNTVHGIMTLNASTNYKLDDFYVTDLGGGSDGQSNPINSGRTNSGRINRGMVR